MKRLVVLLVLPLVFLSMPVSAQDVPSSARSREVIARKSPELKIEFKKAGLTWGAPVFMRIFKKEKRLEVWVQNGEEYSLFKSYDICTYGLRGLGPKLEEGDWRAPEGFYYVPPAMMNPSSRYHLAFNIGYPNKYDRAHGRTGGLIMVHGSCVSVGCYAMRDKRIEEIYTIADAALKNGQPYFRVHVFPFVMNEKNMNKYKENKWFSFWKNLQEGYDLFEKTKIPPNADLRGGRYVFPSSENAS